MIMQAQKEGGGIATINYKPGPRRRWEVSTTLWSLYSRGMSRCTLHRKISGPRDRSGQEWKILPPPGFELLLTHQIIRIKEPIFIWKRSLIIRNQQYILFHRLLFYVYVNRFFMCTSKLENISFTRPCCTNMNTQIMDTVIKFGMASHTSFYRVIFVVVVVLN
jgi:hypothetical protein